MSVRVGAPAVFKQNSSEFNKVGEMLEAFKKEHSTFLSQLYSKLSKPSILICAHDFVTASAKTTAFQNFETYFLPASMVLGLAVEEIELNSLKEATAVLVFDQPYAAFHILHGGSVLFSAYCQSIEDKSARDKFREQILATLKNLKSIEPEQSPFHRIKNGAIEEELKSINYWQNLESLFHVALDRGVYVFSANQTPVKWTEEVLSGTHLEVTAKNDLKASIWNGLEKFEESLAKLPLSSYTALKK